MFTGTPPEHSEYRNIGPKYEIDSSDTPTQDGKGITRNYRFLIPSLGSRKAVYIWFRANALDDLFPDDFPHGKWVAKDGTTETEVNAIKRYRLPTLYPSVKDIVGFLYSGRLTVWVHLVWFALWLVYFVALISVRTKKRHQVPKAKILAK